MRQASYVRASVSDPNTIAIVRGNTPQQSGVTSPPPASGLSFESARPKTSAEHYWAARALKAETRLTEGLVHNREVKGVRLVEDAKRKVTHHVDDDSNIMKSDYLKSPARSIGPCQKT